MTFSPGNCPSAVIRSSEMPSEKYCLARLSTFIASGSTAMEDAAF